MKGYKLLGILDFLKKSVALGSARIVCDIVCTWYVCTVYIIVFPLPKRCLLLCKIFAKHITHSVCFLFVSLFVRLEYYSKTTAWIVMMFLESIRTVTGKK